MKNSLRSFSWLFLATVLIFSCFTAASTQAAEPETVVVTAQASPETSGEMTALLSSLVLQYPILATLIAFIGSMRVWAKPVMSGLHAIVDLTPTQRDDGILKAVLSFLQENPFGRFLSYVLDWLTSIKITPPAKTPDKIVVS